jgi:hypothetical protein
MPAKRSAGSVALFPAPSTVSDQRHTTESNPQKCQARRLGNPTGGVSNASPGLAGGQRDESGCECEKPHI